MTAHKIRRTGVAAAILALAAILLPACSSASSETATIAAPPSSAMTTAEQTATMTWFNATNAMWTRHDFTQVDDVTIGAIRTIYEHEANTADGPRAQSKLTLDDLAIVVPCQNTSPSLFVAYANTDVFTLGDGVQSVAMVFQQDGPTWKLAAAVTHLDGTRWPVLCQQNCPTIDHAALAPGSYSSTLAGVLTVAAGGRAPTPSQAHPFAINSFLSGPGSVTEQSATSIRKDRNDGVQFTSTFIATTNPTFALPLADNSGYWLLGTLEQRDQFDSATELTAKTWPDGTAIDAPHPAAVHHQTDDFLTTYTAIDPVDASHGQVTLDGFFGWPIAATAS